MRHTTATGIVLRKRNIGEQDQFVTFFSPELGKIETVARGARKNTSSFTGHIELLNICEFQIYKSAHSYTLTQCQIRQSFKNVRENLDLTMICFLLIEIFCKITQPEEQSHELYNLLLETLDNINKDTKNELYIENFKIKILKIAGALPDISLCNNCQHRWKETDNIQADTEGHIFCMPCSPETTTSIPFKTMKLLYYLTHQTNRDITNINLTTQEAKVLKGVTDIFLHNFLATELKSEKIINLLRA